MEPSTCLCRQAQQALRQAQGRHGGSEGDLVKGTDVGTLDFSSAREQPKERRERTMGAAQNSSTNVLTTSSRPGDERMQLCYRK